SFYSLLAIELYRSFHADRCHPKSAGDITLLRITGGTELTGDHAKRCDIVLLMPKHRHVPVEIRYPPILFLERQFARDVGHTIREHRQVKLGHGSISRGGGGKR